MKTSNLRSGLLSSLGLFGAFLGLFSLTAVSCGKNTVGPPLNTCKDGVVIDGQCQGKCTPDKCLPNNTCVANQCVLTCTSHADCAIGAQACVPAKEDDTMNDITVCAPSVKSPAFGQPCPNGDECAMDFVCTDGTACGASVCGGGMCSPDPSCKGDPKCVKGLCDDMTPCIISSCPADECKPMSCITGGKGDANAYCTAEDCKTDADCGPGYGCEVTRDPRKICNTQKGNNNFCGKTVDPCLDPGDFSKGGGTFFEGSLCLLRHTCVLRTQCSPCETDLDCSLVGDQHCTMVGTEKVCTRGCANDKNCDQDYHCVSNQCVPRFMGGCVGTGKFCEPCRSDDDCGKPGSTMGCAKGSGDQTACFDESFPDTCMTSADCPTAPGGKHGYCLDENVGLMPGDSVYHHCYLPIDLNSNKTSCW